MLSPPRAISGLLIMLMLLSSLTPLIPAVRDSHVGQIVEEIATYEQDPDGWDELNQAQKSSLVDWSRNSSSQNYLFKSAGGVAGDRGHWLAVDSSGDAYVTGYFSETATFGSTILTSSGGTDIFIAKLSRSGSWQSAVKAGGTSNDEGLGIAVDSSGNAYVTGYFSESATFGSISINATVVNWPEDIFIAKLSSSGSWSWAVRAGGSAWDRGNGIAVDSSGNAYVTGWFVGTATFGSTSLESSGGDEWSEEIFIAKLSSSGSWSWAVRAGGSAYDRGNGIAVDSSGNALVTGYFQGTATFGSTSLTSSGSSDTFIAKLSSSGSWQWVVKAGGTSADGYGIIGDSSGNAYVTGSFVGTATFGSTSLTSSGSSDIFVARLSSSGTWTWAVKAGGSGSEGGFRIAVDSSGNAFVTGSFSGTATFGSTILTSSGGTDIFIAKLSSSGSWRWVVKAGIDASGIAVDSSGNAYVTGSFSGTQTFGGTSLTSSGGGDIFIAKLSISRNSSLGFSSTVKAGGSGYDQGKGIAVNSNGDAYVTGYIAGTTTFGGFSLTSSGSTDVFVAKLSSSGSWQWVVKAGGTYTERGNGIAVDSSGNVYVTGYFSETATFGSTSLGTSGSFDIFVARLSSSGYWQWAIKAGGTYMDRGNGIAVDSSGDVYVTGDFMATVTFGTTSLTSSGGSNMFVAKASTSGSWSWAVRADGNGNGIAVDSSGNAYVTGEFYETATFGSAILTSSGGTDIFIAKLSSSVYWQWAVRAGGSSHDHGLGIAVDSDGGPYVTGDFMETATFGSTSLASDGSTDIFVAKLSSGGSWQWVVKAGGSSDDRGNGIAVDSSGNVYVTGYFSETATFDTSLTSSASSDIFAAKLSSSGFWQWAIKAGGIGDDTGIGIAVNSSGNAYVTGGFEGLATFGTTSLTSSGSPDIFIGYTGPDFDSDSIVDTFDGFPVEPSQQTDQDGDGFGDELSGYHGDSCPTIYGTSWQDRWGCTDMDGDGQSDLFDAFMQNPTQWNDTDGDGLGDNWDGVMVERNDSTNGIGEYWPDAYLPDPSPLDYDNDGFEDEYLAGVGANGPFDDCPLIYGFSAEDRSGCVDSDGDGWSDAGDSHPGDGTQHSDVDGDGYGDDPFGNLPDGCSSSDGNSTEDVYGCPDLDGDGWSSQSDSNDGDANEWSDADEDGYGDNADQCPYAHGNISMGSEVGCPDADGDGVSDGADAFDSDPTQFTDFDLDGFGDDPAGTDPDECPTQAGTSWLGGFGCPDSDRDGWGDVNDAFPTDPTQWDDADGDGYGDASAGRYPDTCTLVNGNSSEGGVLGCPDADEDGWADSIDDFVNDTSRWSDEDGDGFSDQGDDDCPNLAGTSTEPWAGCPDMDADGVMDLADDDTDGDGISDGYERTLSEMFADDGIVFDPYDPSSTPDDFDGDHIPDELDDDWDDDGFPNAMELERGSDAWDDEQTPLNMYGEQDLGFFYKPGEGFLDYYDPEAYEVSASSLVAMATSEALIPILLFPFVLFLAGRRRWRFKRFRRQLDAAESLEDLDDAEKEIDWMITRNKVKIQHALLLRNMFERKRDMFGGDADYAPPRKGRRGGPPRPSSGEAPSRYDEQDYDPSSGSSWTDRGRSDRR